MIREITIKWCIEDVYERALRLKIPVSEKQASDILQKMKKYHDCTLGITWETIDSYLSQL